MRGQVYQKKIIARRNKKIFFISLFSVFVLGLLFSGLSYLSWIDPLVIENVNVIGNQRLSSSVVYSIVMDKLVGNYWAFFSKSNSLIYPKNSIKSSIFALPLVENVNISRDGLKALTVSIKERNEVARWCENGSSTTTNCFSVDENGFIFAGAMASSTDFIYRGLIDGSPIGKQVLPVTDFKNIQFFIHELFGLSINPIEADLFGTGYMNVVLSDGGKLIINMSDDLSVVLSNISSVISEKSIVPDLGIFLKKLDYIKLDSGNKIIYKMK